MSAWVEMGSELDPSGCGDTGPAGTVRSRQVLPEEQSFLTPGDLVNLQGGGRVTLDLQLLDI